MKRWMFALILIALLVSGCSLFGDTPTPTAIVEPTPQPTQPPATVLVTVEVTVIITPTPKRPLGYTKGELFA